MASSYSVLPRHLQPGHLLREHSFTLSDTWPSTPGPSKATKGSWQPQGPGQGPGLSQARACKAGASEEDMGSQACASSVPQY